MKQFVLKVLLFFAFVIVLDFAFGQFFSFLRAKVKGGSTAICEYIANQCENDVIILGSSRAAHHYVSRIIEDSLGVSCFNCGQEGNGIVLSYGRFKMMTNRYKPKLIIYEITPNYDYGTEESNTKYLGYLRPYYPKDEIKELFDVFDDELSFLKMRSKMYQNTDKLVMNLKDLIMPNEFYNGYAPLYGMLKNTNTIQSFNKKWSSQDIDSIKLSYINKLIIESKNLEIPIVFIVSPRYNDKGYLNMCAPAIELCDKNEVPFYDFVDYKPISDSIDLFQDVGHMNNSGAIEYTKMLVDSVLKKELFMGNKKK